MHLSLRGALFALLLAALPLPVFAACTTGQTTCNTDTTSDSALVNVINDPAAQNRIFQLWLQSCANNVWGEAASTAGHLLRIGYCNQVAAGAIPKATLVALVINAITAPEILSTTCPSFANGVLGTVAGCLVDADVNNAIASLLAVTLNTASTTATALIGSTVLTVASATGIVNGMNAYAAGIPAGAVVTNVSGTSVSISLATTAALSVTTVLFTISTGLP